MAGWPTLGDRRTRLITPREDISRMLCRLAVDWKVSDDVLRNPSILPFSVGLGGVGLSGLLVSSTTDRGEFETINISPLAFLLSTLFVVLCWLPSIQILPQQTRPSRISLTNEHAPHTLATLQLPTHNTRILLPSTAVQNSHLITSQTLAVDGSLL